MTATTQPETTHDSPRGSSSPTRDIALVAAFAALISASAYIGAIPVGSAGVPMSSSRTRPMTMKWSPAS